MITEHRCEIYRDKVHRQIILSLKVIIIFFIIIIICSSSCSNNNYRILNSGG